MKNYLSFLFIFLSVFVFSQIEENPESETPEIVAVDGSKIDTIDYLSAKNPMRASLYSAIFPGLGQIYNKKYWKAPLVWGLIGTGIGFIIHYNNQYREYRAYYLDKLYGYELENPTLNNMPIQQLATIQDDRKRIRDYAIALTVLAYVLNVLDATVDAHLYGIKKDPDLSLKPVILQNQYTTEMAMGIGISFKF